MAHCVSFPFVLICEKSLAICFGHGIAICDIVRLTDKLQQYF